MQNRNLLRSTLEYKEFLENVISSLNIHGYYSILSKSFTEEDADHLQKYLSGTFSNIIFIDVNEDKKYFVVDNNGKKTVLRLIESYRYTLKRTLDYEPLQYKCETRNELKRLSDLYTLLEKTYFR